MIKITDLKIGSCVGYKKEWWMVIKMTSSKLFPGHFQTTYLSSKSIISTDNVHLDYAFSPNFFLIC